MKITLDDFCAHWVKGAGFMSIASRFEYNVFNFTTATGDHTKQFFQNSFAAGGFYGSGAKWKPRESNWGKKFTHPVMIDTGELKDSFKTESHKTDINGRSGSGKRIFRKGAKYFIWTTEVSSPQRGKRGKNGKYGRYAAVHNSDPRLTDYTVNQYSSRKPIQRQFIGFSKRLDAELKQFTPILFTGFPFPK
jgi:hypothetical protein